MDRAPLLVVVRVVAADGTSVSSLALSWVGRPSAAEVLGELCVRALQARREGFELVVVEPAELVLLLAALGLSGGGDVRPARP